MSRLGFGGFELDPTSGELWKGGERLPLQEQPLRLLLCLLEKPGQLVGREELQKRVWPGDIHVGFDDGLNAAAWRLRQALGESSEQPRYIETVPRKGYRFMGEVTPLPGRPPQLQVSFPMPVFRPLSGVLPAYQAVAPRRRWVSWITVLTMTALLGALATRVLATRPPVPVVAVTPLRNETGDAAVDYFAAALTRQVEQDLAAAKGVTLLPPERLHRPGGGDGAQPRADRVLTWGLAREGAFYLLSLRLADSRGQPPSEQLLELSPEALREVHQQVAAFVVGQSTGQTPSRPADPKAR